MKSLNKIMVAIIVLLSYNSFAQLSKVEIVATGLTCSMCSNAINKQLISLNEVQKVDIDLNTNTFVVFLKKDNSITPKMLKDKVENAGFFVGEMTIFLPFQNLKVSDNLIVKNDKFSFVFFDTKNVLLNGETKLKIFEKGYLTSKAFKKIEKYLKNVSNNSNNNETIYHVKIV